MGALTPQDHHVLIAPAIQPGIGWKKDDVMRQRRPDKACVQDILPTMMDVMRTDRADIGVM